MPPTIRKAAKENHINPDPAMESDIVPPSMAVTRDPVIMAIDMIKNGSDKIENQ